MLGPGSIEQAHQPDEFIDMAFIEPTRELMGQLIENFLFSRESEIIKILSTYVEMQVAGRRLAPATRNITIMRLMISATSWFSLIALFHRHDH